MEAVAHFEGRLRILPTSAVIVAECTEGHVTYDVIHGVM